MKTTVPTCSVQQAWLAQAYDVLRSELLPEAVPNAVVSYGFPKGRRGRKVPGQCHLSPGDVKTDVIFIHPVQWPDPLSVLHLLVHEVIHTAARGAGHRGRFVDLAKRVGLQKPWTATTPGPELAKRSNAPAKKLPKFPVSAFDVRGKKGSRLRLHECRCVPLWMSSGLSVSTVSTSSQKRLSS